MTIGRLEMGALWLTISAALLLIAMAGPAAAQESDILARGAKGWENTCARCHNLRDPREFRDDQWKVIVMHMRVRAGLTGQEARDILAFLQATNSVGTRFVSVQVPAAGSIREQRPMSGKAIFEQTCIACHGANGTGALPGVPDFTAADSPLSKPDEILFDHVLNGFQSPGSPMAMPPKGGNPNLSESDIRTVLDYMRTAFKR